jgi:hypothetical protein
MVPFIESLEQKKLSYSGRNPICSCWRGLIEKADGKDQREISGVMKCSLPLLV